MLCQRRTCGYLATWATRATRFKRVHLCDIHAAQIADGEDGLDPIEAVLNEHARRVHARDAEGEVA